MSTGFNKKDYPVEIKITHHLHWLSMVFLIISGFYIHAPFDEGLMKTMRYIHFVFMYILAFTWLFRLYYALFGRKKDFADFLPSSENRGKLMPMIRYYLFLESKHPLTARYNPLQKATYNFWFLLLILQGFTGFALYKPALTIFSGAVSFAGLYWIRFFHYIFMWLFIATAAVHIYLSFVEDFKSFKLMFSLKKRSF